MPWSAPAGSKTRYGWNTPVTAPGPQGSVMLRNLREIQSSPLEFLEQTWREHGDVVQFPIPRPATYLISSPEGAREVLVNQHRVMSKRTVQYSTLSLVTGEGLLTADTQAWKPVRRQLAPAFHHEMIALTQGHVSSALQRLDQSWSQLTANGSAIVDVDQEMMALALEITGAALFGSDLSGDAHSIGQATLRALHGVVVRARSPLPVPLAIPTRSNRGMRAAIKELDFAVNRIIESRLANPLQPGAAPRDMLDVLLSQEVEQPLSIQQVRDEVATFIVAGHETVASALTWSWKLLGSNQYESDLLRQKPSRAGIVFDETLRLYPPAWVITRRTRQAIEIDGFEIPGDALLIVSPWVVHRNPTTWQTPKSFLPDRFADGAPMLGYLPFGAGPRLCIGREMAKLEAAMILEHIVQKWQLSPIHSSEVPIDASVTLRPVGGLPMRLKRI